MLIACNTWKNIIVESQGRLAVRGNALGVQQAVLKMMTRDAVLNDITGEIALLLAPQGCDIRAGHLWSEQNSICDELSRVEVATTIQIND